MSTLITNTLQGINTIKYDSSTTAMTIASDGTILPQKVPCCLIFNSSGSINQNLAQTTWTVIQHDSEGFDTHNMGDVANNRINFTTATAGIYQCFGCFRVSTSGSLARFIIRLQKNSSNFCQGEYANNNSSNNKYPIVNAMGLQSFSNGDTLSMSYYLDKSATVNGDNGVASCQLFCYRISA